MKLPQTSARFKMQRSPLAQAHVTLSQTTAIALVESILIVLIKNLTCRDYILQVAVYPAIHDARAEEEEPLHLNNLSPTTSANHISSNIGPV
jgi:hypothetical protein